MLVRAENMVHMAHTSRNSPPPSSAMPGQNSACGSSSALSQWMTRPAITQPAKIMGGHGSLFGVSSFMMDKPIKTTG
jgi:hypothetical protein